MRPKRRCLVALSGALLLVLGAAAAVQTVQWRNDLTIMSHAARVTRDNEIILTDLGITQMDCGLKEEALRNLSEAVRLNPELCNAQYSLGEVLTTLGRHQEAADQYYRALRCYEEHHSLRADYIIDTRLNLGYSLLLLGKTSEAELQFHQVLTIEPENRTARLMLAQALNIKEGQREHGGGNPARQFPPSQSR